MSLTIHGYRVPKKDIANIHHLKGVLTVKPYIPSVFVKPQYVQSYPIYKESDEYIYVPKHYGIQEYGPYSTSTRDVEQTDSKYWEFAGSIREAQRPVVNSFLFPEPHDGILSLQTGGGKTVCALYIASELKLPTMILVHNTFLRDQWIERISAFLPNARIGTVQGDTLDIENKDIIVAMLQTVISRELPTRTFQKIGLVVVDECHHIASESFSQVFSKLTSKHMLGLSATTERKDRLTYVLNWFLGPILYESNKGDKVDEKVKVEVYEFAGDEKMNEIIYNNSGVMFTTLMINKLTEHADRNKFIVQIVGDIVEDSRQILILSDRVEHVKTLFEMLPPEIQKHAGILSRGMKPSAREEFCKSKKILIATYHLCKEGFDLNTLNTLVMATPRPDVVQIVGRVMRQEKDKRDTHPIIIDIVDVPFRRQFQERLKLYKDRSYDIQKMVLE